ncbi:hypothetical protein [Tepidimicrobium xylanilyticum]
MLEKHHIVFKSQGGLDFEFNYKYLTSGQHRGPKGPHMCRETDLKYKRELQQKLEELLVNEFYTVEELIELLGLKEQQALKAFKKIPKNPGMGMKREDVLRRLMGGKLYL